MTVFEDERVTGGRSGWAVRDVLRNLAVSLESLEAVDGESVNGIGAWEDGHVVWIDPEPTSTEPRHRSDAPLHRIP